MKILLGAAAAVAVVLGWRTLSRAASRVVIDVVIDVDNPYDFSRYRSQPWPIDGAWW